MRKLLLLAGFLMFSILSHGQEVQLTAVILGASHAKYCNFQGNETLELLNHSVADFTSGQLFWTIYHGVIDHSPDVCLIQTGGLDILLGIPEERVIQNIGAFHEQLSVMGIKLILMEDFPYWKSNELQPAFDSLNKSIQNFCEEKQLRWVSFSDMSIEENELNPGFAPVLTESGCMKFQAAILNSLQNEISQ